jgi:hypothetical protein
LGIVVCLSDLEKFVVVDNVFVALKSKEEGHNFKGALRLLGIV